MKTTLFSVMIMLIGSFAQASFFPTSTPPQGAAPVLKCNDAMIGLPEVKLNVQVYQGTSENPLPFVTIQRVDMNKGTNVLFSGEVTQRADNGSTLFFGKGMNMRVMGDASGTVKGSIAINDGQNLKYFNVDCAIMYQLQPVPKTPATM
jgi:hypothetical protein